jgi:hypothetical protein
LIIPFFRSKRTPTHPIASGVSSKRTPANPIWPGVSSKRELLNFFPYKLSSFRGAQLFANNALYFFEGLGKLCIYNPVVVSVSQEQFLPGQSQTILDLLLREFRTAPDNPFF